MDKKSECIYFGLKISLLLLAILFCTNLLIENVQCASWEVVPCPTTATPYSVFMVDSDDGWIVCIGGPILRWDGVRWNNVTSPTTTDLTSVFMVSADDGWAVGYNGTIIIIRWDGTSWNIVTSPTSGITGLFSVFMVSADDGWAVGGGTNMLRWNGDTWAIVPKPTMHWLYSVCMVDSDDGWAVGTGGTIIRWDGTSWSNVASPTSVILTAVSMVSADDGWAVGYNGTIIRWDGTSWSNVASPTDVNFSSVSMVSADEGWAVSYEGTIIRWDGTSWNIVTSPWVRGLIEIFMFDSNDGWAVGTSGTILRLSEKPPQASFTHSPRSPIVGEEVVFDASTSYDPDGTIVRYDWEISDAVTGEVMVSFFGDSPGFSLPFSVSGIYNVTLTVTDDSFLTDSITRQVNVGEEEFDLTIENEGYAGVTDPEPGTYTYTKGTDVEVQFIEIADGRWVFDYWLLDGANVGSANSIIVTIDDNHVLTAVSHIQYTFLEITVEGSGTTFPPADTDFLRVDMGTRVAVNATPSEGWTFDYWELDDSNVGTANPYTVLMDDDHQLTAVFTPVITPSLPSVNLTIQVDGSGSTRPSVGDYTFDEGSTVVVDAVADDDWAFGYWLLDGVNVSTSDSYSVLMDANHVLRAVFTEPPQQQRYTLTVDVVGSGSTDLGIGVHRFDEDSMITVTANPSDGWRLDCWMLNGQNVSTEESFTCTLGTNSSLTAVFAELDEPPQPLIPPGYVIPIAVGSGAGAAGVGYAAYRKFYPKNHKDVGKDGEKPEEGEEKEEDENKKKRKPRKKARLELTIVEYPKRIVGGVTGKVKVKIKNLGPSSTSDVRVSVFSSPGFNLQNKTEKISSIQPGEGTVKVFAFTVSRNVNRGEYKLRFTAKGDHARRVVETVTIRAIKIGLLTDPTKEQQLTHYRKWLRNNSLTWEELHNADNIMKLLSYDVILVAPDFDMPAKWIRVLQSFVDNDRILLKTKEKDTVESEISEKILVLLKKGGEEFFIRFPIVW